jgi:molecular chaperone GrpE
MSTEKTNSEEEIKSNEEEVQEDITENKAPETDEEVAEEVPVDEDEAYIKELEDALEQKHNEVEEVTARLRSVSSAYSKQGDEIKATKARLERQMQYKESKNRGEVVSSIFEPFDNLKRCLEGLKKSDIEESHIEGLEMVKSSFMTAFQKLGLEEIPGKGSKFDPNIHEALMNIPVPDPTLNGVVIDVHSTGYRINDIIIRPAKVIIGVCEVPEVEEIEEEEVIQEIDVTDTTDDSDENTDASTVSESDE